MGKSTRWLLRLFGVKKKSKPTKEKCSSDEVDQETLKRAVKEKRRWSFGAGRSSHSNSSDTAAQIAHGSSRSYRFGSMDLEHEQSMHAMAVAAASAVAAEAALAAANAAAEVARLTGNGFPFHGTTSRKEWAATKIQTAFRGYLARRALRALRGVVRLQALFRGHRVRKQATMTLRCMQALIRVQAHVRARRVRMSEEGQAVQRQLSQRRKHFQDRPRRSMEGRNASTGTFEDLHAKVEKREAEAKKLDRALAYAMSQQKIARDDSPPMNLDGSHCEWTWLERWMAARPWESPSAESQKVGRGNGAVLGSPQIDQEKQGLRNKAKLGNTAEPFLVAPNTSSSTSTGVYTWPSPPGESFRHGDRSFRCGLSKQPISPAAMTSHPSTPSMSGRSSKSGLPASTQENSLSMMKEQFSLKQEEYTLSSTTSSPAFKTYGAQQPTNQGIIAFGDVDQKENFLRGYAQFPNYMTPTKSAKAKARSQSAPRQRPVVSEKHSPVAPKKRYSLPWADNLSYSGATQSRRSVSQLRTRNTAYAASVALDRSCNSLNDGHSAWSMHADYRRPFRF